MYGGVELDEFTKFGEAEIRSAELSEEGLTLTRENDETTLTISRYSISNRGIPGIDTEAAETIACVLGIKDAPSLQFVREIVESNSKITFTVIERSELSVYLRVVACNEIRLPR